MIWEWNKAQQDDWKFVNPMIMSIKKYLKIYRQAKRKLKLVLNRYRQQSA